MAILIKNAIIINADKKNDTAVDILCEKGIIAAISKSINNSKARIIDATGHYVLPGLIDMHVHFREPGREDKETIETGSKAAVKGGFTTVMCMPNTDPVIDNAMVAEGIIKEAQRIGLLNVIPAGSITKGRKNQELSDMFELKEAGCLALTDDGASVVNSRLMHLAMKYAAMVGLLLVEHCQDPALSSDGVMNEGLVSTFLGFKGDPAVAETVIIARDIELARYLDTRIHLQHVSLKRSVELIELAKKQGVKVTAEVTPHHFTLTEEAVKTFDPNTKVNPPLRTKEDVEALKWALKTGVLDCIASDHAPHTQEDKEVGFEDAPFGMIGLETSLALAISELVDKEILSMPQLVGKMSTIPAQILGLEKKGRIEEGYDADMTIIDPDKKWVFLKEEIESKSKNSPFIGKEFKGCVEKTIFGGKVVYESKKRNSGINCP